MKKITLLLFACMSYLGAIAQDTCTQTFTVSGQDDDPTVLTINAADVTCNGVDAATSIQLINAAGNLTSTYCSTDASSWYGFDLSVDGGAAVPACSAELNNLDITGFASLTITSHDDDAYSDGISITIDVEVTFTASTPPVCDSVLTSPADGETMAAIDGNITWSAASGSVDGYNLTVGTTTGGTEVLATTDVLNVTSYDIGTLAYSTLYYVTIEPYNANGPATGCTEQTFTTIAPPPTGSICSDPIVVATLPYNATDDTANYGDDYENGSSDCSLYYMSGDDVVYSFTPASDGSFNISLTNIGSTYSGIHVLEGCVDATPTCLGFEGNSGTADRVFDVSLTGGTTYYIVISTWATPQSTTYTLDITENTCTNATVAYTIVDDCATSGGFLIDVEITDMGTATDIIVSNDQDATTHAVTAASTVQFGPYANATDVVVTVVDDNDATCTQNSGAITQTACPPANDECSGGILLTVEGEIADLPAATQISGTIVGATDSGVASPAGTANDDVWYSFVATSTNINIDVTDDFDGVIQLFSGTCGALTSIEHDDYDATYSNPRISRTDFVIGETYYVRVYYYYGTTTTTPDFTIALWTTSALSIDDSQFEGFKYFPNPVEGTLSLIAQDNMQNVAVYNMLGQEVINISPNTMSNDLDMSTLSRGAYFVRVSINGAVENFKVIKE